MLQTFNTRWRVVRATLVGVSGMVLASPALGLIPALPSRAIQQEQLRTPDKTNSLSVEQVSGGRGAQSAVDQIPADAVVVPAQNAIDEAPVDPASAPGLPAFGPSKGAVYTAMANAWARLRARGQQPTPELISQEVGQDMFNMFLNLFPGSETIFAIDSDQFPLSLPN